MPYIVHRTSYIAYKKLVLAFGFLLSLLGSFLLVDNCFAQEVVASRDLIEESQRYNGQVITYRGEAVGDVMERGDYFWVNVLDSSMDSSNAIGVWARIKFKPLIRFVGTYNMQGDYIEIKGTFNAKCRAHAGELDIHAEKIKLINRGEFRLRTVELERRKIALILSVGALCLMTLAIYRSRR